MYCNVVQMNQYMLHCGNKDLFVCGIWYYSCGNQLFAGAVRCRLVMLWPWLSMDRSELWSDISRRTLGQWLLSGIVTVLYW